MLDEKERKALKQKIVTSRGATEAKRPYQATPPKELHEKLMSPNIPSWDRLKELSTDNIPPGFKLPKRCRICVYFKTKGIEGRCTKYNYPLSGIGCCDSYEYKKAKE